MRLALVLLLVAIDASAIGTLCASIETVAFSCSVSSSNVLSVSLLKGPIENPPAVSYRFGRLGAPDLVFPKSSIGSAQKFRSAHYFRYQVDRTELSLSNAGTEYTVFDYFDGEQKPSSTRGVDVSVNGKERELRCKGAVISHLIDLENFVPCDAASALGSCK